LLFLSLDTYRVAMRVLARSDSSWSRLMATSAPLPATAIVVIVLLILAACAHDPQSPSSRFVLHRDSVSVSFVMPSNWEVSPFHKQVFPSYSGVDFTPVGHRSDTGLSVRLSQAEAVDSRGQSAIHAQRLATQREDYPTATSRTVSQVSLVHQLIWVQLME